MEQFCHFNKVNGGESKIYKICSSNMIGDKFISSTTSEYLCNMMLKHIKEYEKQKSNPNINVFWFKRKLFDIFDKYGVNNCCIILLETVKAETDFELKSLISKKIYDYNTFVWPYF